MKVIFDFIPGYCPNCGLEFNLHGPMLDDFMAGNEMYCMKCGLSFNYYKRPQPVYCCDKCGTYDDLGACDVTVYCRTCAELLLDQTESWIPFSKLEAK